MTMNKNADYGNWVPAAKRFAYMHYGRHLMNRNVKKVRNAS